MNEIDKKSLEKADNKMKSKNGLFCFKDWFAIICEELCCMIY